MGSTTADAPAWSTLLDSAEELDCDAEVVQGAIPDGLEGTLYRNGPGGRRFAGSFFDGDGMIRALTLRADGTARFRSRFVHTRKYLGERGRDTPRYRMPGTNLPGGPLRNAMRPPAHTANTNAVWHAERLFACEEGGHPYELDPTTLSTLRMESFAGGLPKLGAFSAHPHVDPYTRELFNFGYVFGSAKPTFRAFRIDRAGRFEHIAAVRLPYISLLHDFAMSERWMAFFLTPAPVSQLRMLLGLDSFFGGMRWQPELGTRVILVPRAGGSPVMLEMEAFVSAHVVCAWDDGDEVVVNLCATDSWADLAPALGSPATSDFAGLGSGTVRRIRINPASGAIGVEELCGLPSDFPRINPMRESRRCRYGYLAANTRRGEGGLYRALLRLDHESGETQLFDHGERRVGLEPVFAPRPDATTEDDGWLLQHVHDADHDRTQYAIFDARAVDAGPVCTLQLPDNQGITFHGCWVPTG